MPMFSEEGSNARVFEGQAYSQFVKCTREVASKAAIESSIMFFCFLVLKSNAKNKYFMDYLFSRTMFNCYNIRAFLCRCICYFFDVLTLFRQADLRPFYPKEREYK